MLISLPTIKQKKVLDNSLYIPIYVETILDFLIVQVQSYFILQTSHGF